MKNITNKQYIIPETDVEDGILMSPISAFKRKNGGILRKSAKDFNQLEATKLDENGLGVQIVNDVNGKAYALFDSQYINDVAKFADYIGKKLGVYTKVGETGGALRAKNLKQVKEYLGFETMERKVLYSDAIAAAFRSPIRGRS